MALSISLLNGLGEEISVTSISTREGERVYMPYEESYIALAPMKVMYSEPLVIAPIDEPAPEPIPEAPIQYTISTSERPPPPEDVPVVQPPLPPPPPPPTEPAPPVQPATPDLPAAGARVEMQPSTPVVPLAPAPFRLTRTHKIATGLGLLALVAGVAAHRAVKRKRKRPAA
jgi:hypothetical protein